MHILRSYWLYLVATLLVMAPLLMPGYILTLDMVFTPMIPLPDHLTSSYPFYALLHGVNLVVPGQIIQKLIMLSIPLVASIGMHRLIHYLLAGRQATWAIVSASLFFAINPFTYDRFMAGQYGVLLGYALLPWIFGCALRWGRAPSRRGSIRLGLLLTLMGIVSVHTLGLTVIVLSSAGLAYSWQYRKVPRWSQMRVKHLALAGLVFVVSSSYWLLPALIGKGRTADTVHRFTPADMQAFATTGSTVLEQLANILQLQGFWAETHRLFLLPQSVFPLWSLCVLALWVVVGYGMVVLWRTRRALAITILLSMAVGIIMALGGPIHWLYREIPLVGGYREPQKFVALVAFGYALCIAYGGTAILQKWATAPVRQAAASCLLLSLLLLLTPTMLWGFRGQLRPHQYPADWYRTNEVFIHDQSRGAVLFLPWHQYMSYGFAQRIIASPAEPFFAQPTVVSDDPELQGAIATTATDQTTAVGALLRHPLDNPQLSSNLARHNIKYVLLAKEYDYRTYQYLGRTPGLQLVSETATLKLYRNTAWREP